MKILLFYFEPFAGDSSNSSAEMAELLPEVCAGSLLIKRGLPVSFRRAASEALRHIGTECPDMVVCIGQAAGRASINLERIAVNFAKSSAPDNDGYIPAGERLIPGAPDACLATVAVDDVAETIRAAGYPCFVSNSAGTFVCNALFYNLLHLCPTIPVAFIHIPLTPAQAAARTASTPSMASATAAAAITLALTSLASFPA